MLIARGLRVRLENFEGPFDLLLQLISKHKMDVTEVALSRVTDEFLDHLKAHGKDWDLDQTSQFIVVAATLLDLKAARLIPSGRWMIQRISRFSKPVICCSPGCCNIARSSRWRPISPARSMAKAVDIPAR